MTHVTSSVRKVQAHKSPLEMLLHYSESILNPLLLDSWRMNI